MPDCFGARINGFAQSGISTMCLSVDPCEMIRAPGKQTETNPDLLVFYFVLSGSVVIEQDGRSTSIGAGDGTLCVGDRPYRIAAKEKHRLLAYKVRRDLLSRSASLENVTARSLSASNAIAPLVINLAHGIWSRIGDLDTNTVHRLMQSLVDMTETAFGLLILEEEQSVISVRKATLRRIKQFIEANLSKEELGPLYVSQALGLSTRYMNRLFNEEGTALSRYIWESRLHLAAKRLLDPLYAQQSISMIAYLHGFKNQSHFSTSFREKYDCSPTDYRTAGKLVG